MDLDQHRPPLAQLAIATTAGRTRKAFARGIDVHSIENTLKKAEGYPQIIRRA
jgi:hypothetical protein